MITLAEVKQAQPKWFSRENKSFFHDVSYRVLHGKVTGASYLVRSTYAWSDMFGNARRLHWRINPIDLSTHEILPLFDTEFRDLEEVKEWLREN